jgi:hypothetical protein
MTQGLLFGSGTSMRVGHTGTAFPFSAPVESQKGSIAVTLTCHFARAMVSTPVAHRAFFRGRLIGLLGKARDPERCIDELLQVCTTEGGSDGLDAAVDVLAKVGPLILDYAWEYLQRDIRNWTPSSERAYQPNDDYWYVLLRAVGRATVSEKERFRLISCCVHADSRGIREGVVEGLRDLGTRAAKERIRRFAEEDKDDFIRKIAREALDELES